MTSGPQPRTAVVLAATALAASLAGWRSALLALGCLALFRLPFSRRHGLVLVSLAGSLVSVLVLLPFAPFAVVDTALRGAAASLTLVIITLGVSWSAAVAELQELGLPRTLIAFLALVARHFEVLAHDAGTAVAVLKVRGGIDRKSQLPGAVSVLVSRLLILAWFRADRVADAMALRGFDGRLPPNALWRPLRTEAWYYGMTALLLAFTVWEVCR